MSRSNPFIVFRDLGCTTAPSQRIPAHYSTHVIDNHEPQAPEQSTASASVVSSHGHTSFQDWTSTQNLPRICGFEPYCTVSSTADTSLCETFSNISEDFRIFQSGSYSMLRMATQPLLSGASRCEVEPSCLTAQTVELDDIRSTFDFQGCSMLGHNMPTDDRSSDGAKSCGMVQDNVRMAFTEYYPSELAETTRLETDNQQQLAAGFSVSKSVSVLQYPITPLTTRNQFSLEDARWLPISPLPYDLNDSSRDDEALTYEYHDTVSPPLQTHQTNTLIINNSARQGSSTARKRDIDETESGPEFSLPSKKTKRAFPYCEIAPKGNLTSRGIIEPTISHIRVQKEISREKGKRNKPLGPEKSKKVTNMREIRACACCFISHSECSEDLVCLRCRKMAEKAAIESPSCLRGPLQFWKGLFFPNLLSGHITQWFLDKWIKERGMTFTDDCITVTLSADPFGFTIPLIVHEVSVTNQECLVVSDLAAQRGTESRGFATQYTLPYGYRGDTAQLQRRCSQYIYSISKHSLCDVGDIVGNTSEIVWKVLKAISGFNQANQISRKEGVLGKGLRVFWMDYLMDRRFAFTYDSAIKALQSFHDPSTVFPETSSMSAALLSRQIKLAIYLELDTYIGDLLEELERRSRRTRASWVTCFCINIILCILVEQVQIATDAIVVDYVSSGQDAADTRKNGIQICQALEELPMKYSWTLFHGIQSKHNPIQSGCPIGNDESQNNGEVGLIDAVRQLMHDHGDEITEKTLEPCLGGCSENPADHARFRTHNSGRHVSRFLRKFG